MTTTTPVATTPATTTVLPSPYDTAASATTRFALELTAWSAGPVAVHRATDSLALSGLALAALLAAPSLFNTAGDKHKAGPIDTPGPVRLAIEIGLGGVAVAAAAFVWPAPVAAAVAATAVAAVISGARRARWLVHGAPATTR